MTDPSTTPANLTVARIGKEANVHSTSIYRRWKTRERLLSEAIDRLLNAGEELPDNGNLEDDLIEFVTRLDSFLRSPTGRMLAYLTTAEPQSGDEDDHRRFWAARFHGVTELIDRAKQRGEIPSSADSVVMLTAVTSPIHLAAVTHFVQPAVPIPALVRMALCGSGYRRNDIESHSSVTSEPEGRNVDGDSV